MFNTLVWRSHHESDACDANMLLTCWLTCHLKMHRIVCLVFRSVIRPLLQQLPVWLDPHRVLSLLWNRASVSVYNEIAIILKSK